MMHHDVDLFHKSVFLSVKQRAGRKDTRNMMSFRELCKVQYQLPIHMFRLVVVCLLIRRCDSSCKSPVLH